MIRKRMKALRMPILLAAGAILASCVMVVREQPGSGEFQPPGEFHETFSFESGGSISIDNGDGALVVSGWKSNEVEIRAARRERDGNRIRVYAMKDALPDVRVDKGDGSLNIRTEGQDGGNDSPVVDYEIHVPDSISFGHIRAGHGDIRISDIYGSVGLDSGEGDLHIENFSGSLRATLDHGSVDAEVLDLRPADEVRIIARQGDIVLRLEVSSTATIEADAPNGTITSDLDLGPNLPATKLSARLGGGGGAVINLSAPSGNIRILRTE
jgi:hypothetical protein